MADHSSRSTALTTPTPRALVPDDDLPPEPYDPADYRWVPVRRKPRFDGWTEEKQRRFIEARSRPTNPNQHDSPATRIPRHPLSPHAGRTPFRVRRTFPNPTFRRP